jgi:hypothetical protein
MPLWAWLVPVLSFDVLSAGGVVGVGAHLIYAGGSMIDLARAAGQTGR